MTAATFPSDRVATGGRVRMLGNETAKGLRIIWASRVTLAPTLFALLVMYFAFQYFVGGGKLVDELVADTTPGMFAYVVSYLAIMRLVAGILEERNAGTLEQSHLSPLPAWQLAVGRVAVALLESVVIALVVTVIVLVTVGVGYRADGLVVLPATLMLAGIAGFALIIAAASFTYPGIGALVHVIQMALMMLNGSIVPVEVFPRWLELIAKLAPATLGVSAIRRILVDGESLTDLAADGALGWLVVHSAVLATAGWAVYQWQVRRALRDGRMGPS